MTYLTTVMMICSQVINLLFTLIPFIVVIVYFKEAKTMFLTPEGFKSFIKCQKCNVWVKMKHHVNFSALATFRTTPSPP